MGSTPSSVEGRMGKGRWRWGWEWGYIAWIKGIRLKEAKIEF